LTRKQYPFVYNTRNCQKSVRNDFARNVKSEFNNNNKRDLKISQRNVRNYVKSDSRTDLKIDRRLSLPRNQGAFLNPRPASVARRTLTAGTRCFVT
jgi:hypothetical protein